MRLYLVQHGDALPKAIDAERPLSERGRRDVERVAVFLTRAGVRVPTILHSGKRRAGQTAELLADRIGDGTPIRQTSGIDPMDPVPAFVPFMNKWTNDTMVIGHLPFMGKLVSLLMVGDENAEAVSFRPGAVVCLERDDDGSWSLVWMVEPRLLTSVEGPSE